MNRAIYEGLIALSRQVEETWLATDYPANVRSNAAQFRHACIHATKAVGKISALVDHADHQRLNDAEAIALRAELPKLLADLVRCAAKMAETAPNSPRTKDFEPINFANAYIDRAEQLAKRWGH